MEITLDIETAPDENINPALLDMLLDVTPDKRLTDPFKINADIAAKQKSVMDKFALSPLTGKVIAVGIGIDQNKPNIFINLGDEREVLLHTKHALSSYNYVFDRVIGYNSKSFDIPFLRTRMGLHHIDMNHPIPENRYDQSDHFDVMLALNGFSNQVFIPLRYWAVFFGLSDDPTESGKDVLRYYENRDVVSITEKLTNDIETTRAIYYRIVNSINDRRFQKEVPKSEEGKDADIMKEPLKTESVDKDLNLFDKSGNIV